jgi:electron transfer flavoprotein alpha/beta subunit
MRFLVCLHGASVARSALPLHPTDRHAIALGTAAGAEMVVLEAVGERGSAPMAVGQALDAGALRAVRLVEPALLATDAHSTGYALATAIDHLKVDAVLFGADADPEGVPDVPASIAHHMTALFVTGAVGLKTGDPTDTRLELVVENSGWLRRLRIPMNAVVGINPGRGSVTAARGTLGGLGANATTPPPATVQVMTLQDLHLDPALIRRRNDLRGVVEPAPRPLVTLTSAAAVAGLLRSQ